MGLILHLSHFTWQTWKHSSLKQRCFNTAFQDDGSPRKLWLCEPQGRLRRQQSLAVKSLPIDALVSPEKQRTLPANFSDLSSEEKTLPCPSWSTASSWDQQPVSRLTWPLQGNSNLASRSINYVRACIEKLLIKKFLSVITKDALNHTNKSKWLFDEALGVDKLKITK